MKKISSILAIITISALALAGCGKTSGPKTVTVSTTTKIGPEGEKLISHEITEYQPTKDSDIDLSNIFNNEWSIFTSWDDGDTLSTESGLKYHENIQTPYDMDKIVNFEYEGYENYLGKDEYGKDTFNYEAFIIDLGFKKEYDENIGTNLYMYHASDYDIKMDTSFPYFMNFSLYDKNTAKNAYVSHINLNTQVRGFTEDVFGNNYIYCTTNHGKVNNKCYPFEIKIHCAILDELRYSQDAFVKYPLLGYSIQIDDEHNNEIYACMTSYLNESGKSLVDAPRWITVKQ